MSPGDARAFAPATARNREPIAAVLRRVLPERGLVLEVASGSGEHSVYLARVFPSLIFQPSDAVQQARRSIAAWIAHEGLGNVRPPLALDATEEPWPVTAADAVLCVNMIHIAPIEACAGLMRGAASLLAPGAPLVTYGPYALNGRQTAPSNEAFDADLRRSDPRWGVRDVAEVSGIAARHGLALVERVDMPANNMTLVFLRGRHGE